MDGAEWSVVASAPVSGTGTAIEITDIPPALVEFKLFLFDPEGSGLAGSLTVNDIVTGYEGAETHFSSGGAFERAWPTSSVGIGLSGAGVDRATYDLVETSDSLFIEGSAVFGTVNHYIAFGTCSAAGAFDVTKIEVTPASGHTWGTGASYTLMGR